MYTLFVCAIIASCGIFALYRYNRHTDVFTGKKISNLRKYYRIVNVEKHGPVDYHVTIKSSDGDVSLYRGYSSWRRSPSGEHAPLRLCSFLDAAQVRYDWEHPDVTDSDERTDED